MMKAIRDEKGITLVELLAALAIAAVVLSVAILLLSSVNHLSLSTSQTYEDKSAMKFTMSMLTTQLSDSTQAVYFAVNKELRYKTGSGYKSVMHDAVNSRLTIYDFGGTEAQFKDKNINRLSNNTLYMGAVELASNVTAIDFRQSDGTIVPETPLVNGELIEVSITFSFQRMRVNGGSIQVANVENTSVKLLDDSTSK